MAKKDDSIIYAMYEDGCFDCLDPTDSIVGFVLLPFLVVLAIVATNIFLCAAVAISFTWGGGQAVVNYYKSFKVNMIDSNRKQHRPS